MDCNRDVSVKKGGGQWKKKEDFLPPNKTNMSFLFLIDFCRREDDVAKADWRRALQEDRWRMTWCVSPWLNDHFTRIADDDTTCQAMIIGVISRGSLTMMRRVRLWLKESFHADWSDSYPLSWKFRRGNQCHIINPCQVKVGERIKSTAQIAPTSRRDIRRSRRWIKPKFWGQLSLSLLFPSMPPDL